MMSHFLFQILAQNAWCCVTVASFCMSASNFNIPVLNILKHGREISSPYRIERFKSTLTNKAEKKFDGENFRKEKANLRNKQPIKRPLQ